jgi:hypothetical protein
MSVPFSHARIALVLLVLVGCPGPGGEEPPDPCAHDGALADCLAPTMSEVYYAETSSLYFDTMDHTVDLEDWPPYSELVARWEWPPWLKLTAYGRDNIEAADTFLQLFPSTVPERDCRAFDTQPFGRCYVVFYYDDHEGLGCPIYEEFTFNDAGEITFIEAWSDVDGLRPTAPEDPWAENGIARLSSRIPGLGNAHGLLDLDSEWMQAAADEDEDVADFVTRANDWYDTWMAEFAAAGDDYWERGCGW